MEPPASLAHASPLERYYRMLDTIGGEMEAAVGQVLGATRARELREKNDGWGMHVSLSGCPDDSAGSADAE